MVHATVGVKLYGMFLSVKGRHCFSTCLATGSMRGSQASGDDSGLLLFFSYTRTMAHSTLILWMFVAKPDFLEVSVNRFDVLETYHVRSTNICLACVVGPINDNASII